MTQHDDVFCPVDDTELLNENLNETPSTEASMDVSVETQIPNEFQCPICRRFIAECCSFPTKQSCLNVIYSPIQYFLMTGTKGLGTQIDNYFFTHHKLSYWP